MFERFKNWFTQNGNKIRNWIIPVVIGIGLGAIVVSIWWTNYLRLSSISTPEVQARYAALGDSFGALNTLFSGLAFAGVIFTIVLQSIELSLQRKELRETKDELEKSATAQMNSAKLQALSVLASSKNFPGKQSLYEGQIEKILKGIYSNDVKNSIIENQYLEELYHPVFPALYAVEKAQAGPFNDDSFHLMLRDNIGSTYAVKETVLANAIQKSIKTHVLYDVDFVKAYESYKRKNTLLQNGSAD